MIIYIGNNWMPLRRNSLLAPKVSLQIAGKASPISIIVLCHRLVIKRGQVGAISRKYRLNSKK